MSMYIPANAYDPNETCEACDCLCNKCESSLDYCCNKRPLLTYFIVLSIWTVAITGLIYSYATKKCPGSLDLTDDTSAEIVLNYPIEDAEHFLFKLMLGDHQGIKPMIHQPVILSVTSQGLLEQTQIFIDYVRNNVWEQQPEIKLVIYDMDLTLEQHETVKNSCDCELRIFPYRKFPHFVKNLIAAWQPLTIQLLLQDYSFVVWLDPTAPINVTQIRKALEIAQAKGIATAYDASARPQKSLAEDLNIRTFKHLGEVQCAFKDSYRFNTSLLLIHEDGSGYVKRYIMRPWVSCALTTGCMSVSFAKKSCSTSFVECNEVSSSVLSIILHRIYHNDYRDKGKFPFDIS